MEIWLSKLTSLILLLLAAVVSGLLSLRVFNFIGKQNVRRSDRRIPRGTFILDGLNCFAGGVFFATSMLHLLPDVRKDVQSIMEALQKTSDFAIAEFLASLGVFIVMCVEQTVVHCRQRQKRKNDLKKEESLELLDMEKSSDTEANDRSRTLDTPQENGSCPEDTNETRVITFARNKPSTNITRSMVLLLALSTHTIFEGLALGLQDTTKGVWTLFTAILLHKVIMSFSAGLRFAENLENIFRAVVFVLVFSVMSPLGVAFGLAVSETGYKGLATRTASAVLQGLATGTFIYVTFFEILTEQLSKRKSILKVVFVLIGYSCIAVLDLVTGDKA